jgi:tetratricopeptide (TPR) repeat protein
MACLSPICLSPLPGRAPQALRVLAAAALALLLAACAGSHERYMSHVERGKRYLAEDNIEKASVEFRNALQIEPKNPECLYLNGTLAEQRGNVREAVGLYQAAIDLKPAGEQPRAALARLLVLGGASQRALEVIGPGLIEHPDSADLLAARAAAGHQLKDDVDAVKDAERAVQLQPANENAVAVLAGLYVAGGDRSRALSLVNEAVNRAPASVDLRRVLSGLYIAEGQPEQAEEQMRKIIEIKPQELAWRLLLAGHYAQLTKMDEAQGVLLKAVQDLPSSDRAKLELVNFIATRRSREQGEKILRDFLAREPDNEDLRIGLGALLQRAGAAGEAIAAYQEVIRRSGTGSKGLAARDRIAAIQLSQHRLEDAQRLVTEVLKTSPRDADALILRANIELERNDPAEAVVDLRAALRDQPRSVPLHRTLARAYLLKGDQALAEEALRTAVDLAPQEVVLKIELAQVLMQTDRAAQAVTLLEQTLQQSPHNAQLTEVLAQAYLAKHDLARARAAAEDLERLRPDSPVGFEVAGIIAQEDHRMEDAQKSYERALELKPGAPAILASLARLALTRGDAKPAIGRLQAAIEHDPRNVQLVDLLGELYLAAKDLPRAADLLTRALAIDPHWWMAYRALAQTRLASGDPAGAMREYEAGIKAVPGQPQLTMELSSLYEKQGRIDEAIARYEELGKHVPRLQPLAANNIAMLLATYKTDQASLDRARELTAGFISSENSSMLDTNGWVRYKRREYQDAVAVLERALERAPDSRVIRYHLGMTELKLGQLERARTDLERALSGSAAFSGADEARAALVSLTTKLAGAAPKSEGGKTSASRNAPGPLSAQ